MLERGDPICKRVAQLIWIPNIGNYNEDAVYINLVVNSSIAWIKSVFARLVWTPVVAIDRATWTKQNNNKKKKTRKGWQQGIFLVQKVPSHNSWQRETISAAPRLQMMDGRAIKLFLSGHFQWQATRAISLNSNALSYFSMRLFASDSFLFSCFYLNRPAASPPGVGERSQPLETKLLPDWKSLQLRCRVPFGLSRSVSYRLSCCWIEPLNNPIREYGTVLICI